MAAEAFGIAAGAIGLAATVFQTAKRIRDTIHTAKLEKREIVGLLEENQEEMDLLAELYNEHKELLDQSKLTQDLERLRAKFDEYYKWLVEADDKKPHRRTPTLKAIWKAGDLKPKLETWNKDIIRMRSRWQNQVNVRMIALLQDTKSQVLDRLDNQDRVQTNATLTLEETIRAEATEVIKVIQHTTVQTHARSLSMHSCVEPDGFTSVTTRVTVDTTSSLATFSILSPDASLSYDRIKMRLKEYSQHLKSDSPTIAFTTEHGKTIVCRKQTNEIEDLLKSAKELLQDMIEAKNVSTVEAIHRLSDLARVLDQLKLQEECLVVGDCAIKLAQALGLRAVKFQIMTAETITRIAGLDVYKSRMRPLFIQAISLCEATMIEDESDSARMALLTTLHYAGTFAKDYPALRTQWLGRAVDLIAERPSAMGTDETHGLVYRSYGMCLFELGQYPKALAVDEQAVALSRSLASKYDGPYHKGNLACALQIYGITLRKMGRRMDVLSVESEAVSLFRALVVRGQEEYKDNLADALLNYGYTLYEMGHLEDALGVQRETIALCRALAIHGKEGEKKNLVLALQNYGHTLCKMGCPDEALSVYQEVVPLARALAVHGQEERK